MRQGPEPVTSQTVPAQMYLHEENAAKLSSAESSSLIPFSSPTKHRFLSVQQLQPHQ